MSTTDYPSSFPRAAAAKRGLPSPSTALWRAVLTLALAAATMPAGAADTPAKDKDKDQQKQPGIIAEFRLEGELAEVPAAEDFPLFGPPGTSLHEVIAGIAKAADDAKVKAVVILPDGAEPGSAQLEELRAAMALVRSRGKDVFVLADSLDMSQYVLACGASRVSVVPTGDVLVPGLHGSSLHLRGLLDKLGVKPDFLTEGAYKSAAELFMREQPSPEADQMMNWLMDSRYARFKELIAQGRKADAAKVQGWVDGALWTAAQAKAAGLIDAVEQAQDFDALLRARFGEDVVFDKKYGRKTQPTPDLSSPLALFKLFGDLFRGPPKKAATKPVIAIVHVNGPILTGKSEPNPFGGIEAAFSSELRAALDKTAADDNIKAVVLRIDSPGGSVTASEIILDATKRVKAKKPLVVSMGDVAGSGGYYVACAADTIFADATTLTGSIGVLAGKVATTELWKKIGITFKEYKRGQNAGIFSTDEVFTDSERARVRALMDEVYDGFKKHVTDIRGNRLKKPIDDLAGGRVYTGQQALELGLVDRLGTMRDAIAFAAEQAKIKDYDLRVVPEPKGFMEQLMEQFTGERDDSAHVRASASADSLLRLAAPCLQHLDHRRVAAVLSALRRLQILQKETVVLSMPEILQQD
jgi:protease-4